jgi:rfaE bifunctional protein kinase chain/domain
LLRIDFEEAPSDIVLRDKLSQFNALLPDYDIVVLSDYAKGALVNVADMIAAARSLGKQVLVDPKGDDFSPYAGASLLTPNRAELQHIVGSWKTEEQLTTKAQRCAKTLALEALLVTRSEDGMTLCTRRTRPPFPRHGARGVRRVGRRRHGHRHAGHHAGRRCCRWTTRWRWPIARAASWWASWARRL